MKLKLSTKISYGVGGVADEAMYTLAGTFLLFFLTSVAGLAPAAAGSIVALGSVWEAICGPVTGFLSDNMETRYGKRKPFLLAASFPVALTTTFLFTKINAPYGLKLIYYLIMTLLYWQAFAMYFVPYLAWGSDLTSDYKERTVLRTFAYFFNQLGMALGLILPTAFVDFLMNMGKSRATSWMFTGGIIGIACAAALLTCGLTIHETDNPGFVGKSGSEKAGLIPQLKRMFCEYAEIVKLRPIRYIIGASLLYLAANTFFLSDRVYFFTYNQRLSAKQITTIMTLIILVGISLSPLVAFICGRIDKKHVFTAGVGMSGVFLAAGKFVGIESFRGSCVASALYCIGNTCYWQLMPSMIYDVCEAAELASGEKHSGQVISLQALSESLSVAIGSQMLGIILQLAGFEAAAKDQSALTLSWIDSSFSIIPGICMLVVAAIIYKHPINGERFNAILLSLKRKERGEEIDMEEFSDIYGRRAIERLK